MPGLATSDPADQAGRSRFRVTLGVLLLALVLANLPPTAQEPLAGAIRGSVLRPFLRLQEVVVAARARAVEASVLQARVDSLTAVAVDRSPLAEENRRLRGLLRLSERVGPRWMAVQVLRPGTQASESILLVDAGEDLGLAPRSPVITPDGLAGVIREAYRHYAVGMDWSHPDFRASAMTADGEYYGMVLSARGRFAEDARMRFEGLPYHARIEPGTLVVSSGLGGVFPRGIPIGRVGDVAEEEPQWRKSYWLEPRVAVGSVTAALVARQSGDPLGDVGLAWEEEAAPASDSTGAGVDAPPSAGGGA
ncbi:MAG: rod shape-determining protein MreC [Longimicrobiales bacterium]|nr:rod shape-determining protein MreC [Longimicrobiales bacterium]